MKATVDINKLLMGGRGVFPTIGKGQAMKGLCSINNYLGGAENVVVEKQAERCVVPDWTFLVTRDEAGLFGERK